MSHSDAERAIGQLVSTLQQDLQRYTGISVTEVVKAGSMGHGTTVPGNFDIDLVLYSSNVEGDNVRDYGYGSYLKKLEEFITDRRVFGWGTISNVSTTRYAVQFKYQNNVDVDLLVSPVWWDYSPNRPDKFFLYLRDKVPNDAETRHRFSVNASKWQVAFMKSRPSKVKELITRAKAWRNRLWPKSEGGRGRPSSFLISLLVLRAYENQENQRSGYASNDERRTTERLKSIVRNHRSMNIYWEEYYRARDYPTLFRSSTPRLIDPANPANNVYQSGIGSYPKNQRSHDYADCGDGDWSDFERKVEQFDLEKSVQEIQEPQRRY
uniref:Putative (2-5)A-2 synthetase n=1 Tax=Suberites domuncula TaxID=55567 RepID=Q8WPV6_SUBDO|nr:putative (2-5)A-2 synthetase [Suberites domuncula]